MKKLFRFLIITIMVMVCGTVVNAQDNKEQKLSREELAVKQANYIAEELALDDATAQKYVDTYCRYQKEIWNLGPKKGLNSEQRLDRSQQILDLRKKYNSIYLSFLTERQLDKAYKLEKNLITRMKKNNVSKRKAK